jgi:hypothetical protein
LKKCICKNTLVEFVIYPKKYIQGLGLFIKRAIFNLKGVYMKNTKKNKKSGKRAQTMKIGKRTPRQRKMPEVAIYFTEMVDLVKLYHWKTKVYSQHKATDQLHEKLSEYVDQFIEVLLGKEKNRIDILDKKMKQKIKSIRVISRDEKDFKNKLFQYRSFLIDLNSILDSEKDSDLLNIRDEILASINQFLYLMAFD